MLKFICHGKKERCLKIGNIHTPLCYRCIFLYAGIVISFISSNLLSLYEVLQANLVFTIVIVITLPSIGAIDWFLQETTEHRSNNFRRSWTGFLVGCSSGLALYYIIFQL